MKSRWIPPAKYKPFFEYFDHSHTGMADLWRWRHRHNIPRNGWELLGELRRNAPIPMRRVSGEIY